MSSIMAWRFAHKVSEAVRNNTDIDQGQLMRECGYTKQSSLKPKRVRKSKTFQRTIKPTMEQIEQEMNRILSELGNKDVTKERYDTLVTAYEKFFKVKQLSTGGATENHNVIFEISEKIANKNANATNA